MSTRKELIEEDEIIDEPIYDGGPTSGQVDEWKELYGQIYMTEVTEDDTFIWRSINRKEFKEIMKIDNADALYREERVCEKCILWPEGYNFSILSESKAGIPTVLAEQIMDKSGFQAKSGAIPL